MTMTAAPTLDNALFFITPDDAPLFPGRRGTLHPHEEDPENPYFLGFSAWGELRLTTVSRVRVEDVAGWQIFDAIDEWNTACDALPESERWTA